MDLTSYRRVLFALGSNDPLTDDFKSRRIFSNWVPAISAKVETFLDRKIELTTHIEYANSIERALEYFIDAYPIQSITSVYSDMLGLYNGNEVAESNYYIGETGNSIVLDTSIKSAHKGLKFTYIGGLAVHGVNSTFVIENEGATAFAANNYVEGQTSQAMGYVISKAGTTIVIEVLYGVFQVGEQIKGKTTWDNANFITNMEADIASVTSRSLAEAYPNITRACELEIRYMNDHKSDFENAGTTKAGTNRRDMTKDYDLVPEVRSLLEPYARIHI